MQLAKKGFIALAVVAALMLIGCSGDYDQSLDASLSSGTAGFSQSDNDAQSEDPADSPDLPEGRRIYKDYDQAAHIAGIYTDPMYLSTETPLYKNNGANELFGTVQYYVDVEVDEDGHFIWDDSQEVSLLVVTEDGFYPLLSKTRSNGSFHISCYQDGMDDSIGVLVLYKASGGITLTEYRYLPDEDTFSEVRVYEKSGNIW